MATPGNLYIIDCFLKQITEIASFETVFNLPESNDSAHLPGHCMNSVRNCMNSCGKKPGISLPRNR